MALWAYALRTVAQVKALGWVISGSSADALIEECANEASAMVDKAWGRDLVSRGSLTEYHPRLRPGEGGSFQIGCELRLNEWPIVSVTTVHEDSARAYSTPLVVDTDYVVTKPAGKLIRVSGSQPRPWLSTWRAVKVVYVAGYQNTAGSPAQAAAVPPEVLRVFDELVGWMIRQRAQKEVGLTVTSDAAGGRTFSGPAYITTQMQATLDQAGASQANEIRTGERDA